jgi:hypothetical protein
MEKVCWSERVRHEVLHIVKKERNILRTIKIRNATELTTPYIGTAFENTLLRKNNRKSERKERKKT